MSSREQLFNTIAEGAMVPEPSLSHSILILLKRVSSAIRED
jgi:hypothetical protein